MFHCLYGTLVLLKNKLGIFLHFLLDFFRIVETELDDILVIVSHCALMHKTTSTGFPEPLEVSGSNTTSCLFSLSEIFSRY